MTWVKICGMTNLEDARAAIEAGAQAVGFVFWDRSPRKIDPEKARKIVRELPPNIEKVGVFVDHSLEDVQRTAEAVGLSAAQLHADHYAKSTAEVFALRKRDPDLKLILVCPAEKFLENNESFFASEETRRLMFALMLDSGTKQVPGGTGIVFNWTKAHNAVRKAIVILPIIVAGGLTPANVGEAIARFEPFGVDVSTGVEREPGKKDPEKVRSFLRAVRRAEQVLGKSG